MSINNKTYQPLSYFTIKATAELLPNRFISFTGAYPESETKALGITDTKWISGENASVITIGTAVIESSVALNAGDKITTDTDGKAKKATGTMPVNGRSLDTITGAGFVRILIGG